jgi:hypothetical protein
MSTTLHAPTQEDAQIAAEARRDDDDGAARPGQAESPPAGHAGAVTQTHDYEYWLAVPGGRSRCRIRIYQVGGRNIGLATQQQDKFGGTALTDHAAHLATQVEQWHHTAHDGGFTWVEHYEFPRGPDPQGRREIFALVTFERDAAGALTHPTWQSLDRAAVEALVGQAVGI